VEFNSPDVSIRKVRKETRRAEGWELGCSTIHSTPEIKRKKYGVLRSRSPRAER
jgi:hypothetical protein